MDSAMPDISMCRNSNCPKHETCYRFTAVPNPKRQVYAGFKPTDNVCMYFIDNVEYESEYKR